MILEHAAVKGVIRLISGSRLKPGWQNPVFYLVGGKNLVLIDTGFEDKETVATLHAITQRSQGRIEALVITHGHIDHAGGIKQIKADFHPKVFAHQLEKPALAKRGMADAIDLWLSEGQGIDTELGQMNVIHTPGHSPGHICLDLEKEKVIFTGDLVVGDGTSFVGPPDGDMSDYMDSLHRVEKLNAKIMLPGHGPVIGDTAKHMKELIDHRLLREVQILKLLAGNGLLSSSDLAKRIYVGLIHPALYPVAEITVLGHLIRLEKDGKVSAKMVGGEKRYRASVRLPF